jgi:hypothetical protein
MAMLGTLLSASLVGYRGTLGKKMERNASVLSITDDENQGEAWVAEDTCSSFFLSFRKSHGHALPGIHKLHSSLHRRLKLYQQHPAMCPLNF